MPYVKKGNGDPEKIERYEKVMCWFYCAFMGISVDDIKAPTKLEDIPESAIQVMTELDYNDLVKVLICRDLRKGVEEGTMMRKYGLTKSVLGTIIKNL